MQEGTTPHRTEDVFETLCNCFNTRVIGLNYPKFAKGGLEWPPYSPDLNPLDFLFWDYLKDTIYKNNPKTLSELKNSLTVAIKNIEVQVLQCLIENLCKRLEICQESDGSHFEQIRF
jgi:transposase